MKLTMRRSEEKTGMFGRKIVFDLYVQVQMSEEELYGIRKYKLEKYVVVECDPNEPWKELLVKDLPKGRTLRFDTLGELVENEEAIADALKNLKGYLEEAAEGTKDTVVEI